MVSTSKFCWGHSTDNSVIFSEHCRGSSGSPLGPVTRDVGWQWWPELVEHTCWAVGASCRCLQGGRGLFQRHIYWWESGPAARALAVTVHYHGYRVPLWAQWRLVLGSKLRACRYTAVGTSCEWAQWYRSPIGGRTRFRPASNCGSPGYW